jgi:UDP-glucose 4-epimerase
MARYLVTGGAGFIGSSIAEALLSHGDSVAIVDDFSSGRRENLETLRGSWDLFEGSILDGELVARAMKGVEVVFHEGAIPSVVRSVENPQATMAAGVQGTTVVLDVARHAGVRRVIFAASSAAYGDTPTLPKVETMPARPLSPYAASKLAGEHLMRIFSTLYGVETLSLRYFNVFGSRQDPKSEYAAVIPNFIMAALEKRRPIVYGDGEQTRDFCHIENTVRANLLAAGTPRKLEGQVVNVACAQRTSLNELLKYVGELAGSPQQALYQPSRAGDVRDSLADIGAARDLIGYEPTIDIVTGLRRTYEYFSRRRA